MTDPKCPVHGSFVAYNASASCTCPSPISVSADRPATDCPRARSDMTPCIVRDGEMAATAGGECVGCGYQIAPDWYLLTAREEAALRAEWDRENDIVRLP